MDSIEDRCGGSRGEGLRRGTDADYHNRYLAERSRSWFLSSLSLNAFGFRSFYLHICDRTAVLGEQRCEFECVLIIDVFVRLGSCFDDAAIYSLFQCLF